MVISTLTAPATGFATHSIASRARVSGKRCEKSEAIFSRWACTRATAERKSAALAQLDPEDVDLLLGEDARAQGSRRRGHAHHHDPPGGTHQARRLRQRPGIAGGVDHHWRSLPVGPGLDRVEQLGIAAPRHLL